MSFSTSENFDLRAEEVRKLLPKIPEENGFLLLNISLEHLRDNFTSYLNKKRMHYEVFGNNLKIEIERLDFFVLDIIDNYKLFDEIQMEAVNALFLEKGEKLDLDSFGKTLSLSRLYRLVKGKDLLYILQNKTLTTYFQPIIDIKNNEIFAYECLSRGFREDGSLMGSSLIFKTAAQNDLLYYLDREAREKALTTAMANKIDKKIFINFVPTAIQNPKTCLADTLEWTEKLGYKPENIVFEIIETEHISDSKHLKKFLKSYREKGFGIALDDIGSGYSSLSLLAELKPDYIKVDMEIIRDIDKNKFKQTIFKALAYVTREQQIKLLAEGVETKAELDFCVSEGVDFVQGFYFSKPTVIPLAAIEI